MAGAAADVRADRHRACGRPGWAATLGAGLLGPGLATYTAALICDTAVPAWHEGYREMPYLFAGPLRAPRAASACWPPRPGDAGPARDLAVLGAAVELAAKRRPSYSRLGGPGGAV